MGFFARVGLAFALFFKLLADAALASRVKGLLSGAPPEPAEPVRKKATETDPSVGALQLLAAFQREGRFVDFVQEDVTGVSDEDVGAAARMVHSGCRKVVAAWFAPEAALAGEEGARVVLEQGFDKTRIRLTGNVTGDPPFAGTLAHHGWRVTRTALPTLTGSSDPKVVAPAEVEL